MVLKQLRLYKAVGRGSAGQCCGSSTVSNKQNVDFASPKSIKQRFFPLSLTVLHHILFTSLINYFPPFTCHAILRWSALHLTLILVCIVVLFL